MGKTKTLTEKQKQRIELNAVLDYNEAQMVAMQKQDWKNLTDDQINVLENFIATAVETLRICPPAYVGVASNTVAVRAKATQVVNLVTNPDGSIVREEKPDTINETP
jgi:hypothetical protein